MWGIYSLLCPLLQSFDPWGQVLSRRGHKSYVREFVLVAPYSSKKYVCVCWGKWDIRNASTLTSLNQDKHFMLHIQESIYGSSQWHFQLSPTTLNTKRKIFKCVRHTCGILLSGVKLFFCVVLASTVIVYTINDCSLLQLF